MSPAGRCSPIRRPARRRQHVALALSGALVALSAQPGCSRPLARARTAVDQPVFAAERAAAERMVAARGCALELAALVPGLGQLCLGKRAEGALLAAAGAAELATIIAVGESAGYDHPGAALALIGLQDVLVYGYVDVRIERSLAARELYAPQDSLGDLLAAPFNRRVLARSDVWAGTLILVAAGVGASLLLDGGDIERDEIASRPNVFGHEFHPGLGYPLGLGAFGLLFSHVAVAEEALFRGELQSAIARTRSPEAGWLWASLLFGATHSLNALFLPADERTRYLLLGVPFITAVGSYIGHTYRRSEYSLAVPVAIHFWYDVLLSATFFALDPKNSPLSAGVRLHF